MASGDADTFKIIGEKNGISLWIGNGTIPSSGLTDPVAKTVSYTSADVSGYTTTEDYVGKYLDTSNGYALVTEDNKDLLSITPGTTGAYTAESVPLPITPKLGWCYVDAKTGNFYIYDGSSWTNTSTKWTGAFL